MEKLLHINFKGEGAFTTHKLQETWRNDLHVYLNLSVFMLGTIIKHPGTGNTIKSTYKILDWTAKRWAKLVDHERWLHAANQEENGLHVYPCLSDFVC